MMQSNVGIVRTEDEMQSALPALEALWVRASKVPVEGNRDYNPGWHTALDLPNMLTISEVVTRSALLRKESRGAHFREDYPEKSTEEGKANTVVRKSRSGEMEIEQIPLVPQTDEQRQVIEEMG